MFFNVRTQHTQRKLEDKRIRYLFLCGSFGAIGYLNLNTHSHRIRIYDCVVLRESRAVSSSVFMCVCVISTNC